MKVLFITHYSELLGANLCFLSIIRNLKNQYGCEPIVLLPNNGPICRILEKEAIEYYIFPYYWWLMKDNCYDFMHFIDNLNKNRRNFVRSRKFAKNVLREKRIDLVYSNSVTINVGVFIASFLHINHIWHFREDMKQFGFIFTPLISRAILWHRATKKFITISDFITKDYRKYLPKRKMVKLYDGVDLPSNIHLIAEQKDLSSSKINICCVGAIAEQKNQKDAIAATAILKSKGYNVNLHLIGPPDDDYKNILLSEIQKSDIKDNVFFEGMRNDVFAFLKNMDIAIMPSRDEAFGRVTVEYMLMGLPVIASNSGANPELVKNGRNGFLYTINHPEEIAGYIEHLIKDNVLFNNIRNNNIVDARIFSEQKNISSLYREFEKILTLKY